MKKIIGISLPFLVLFVSSSYHLESKVTFGSRASALKVSPGARLNINSSNFTIDGTLVQDRGANVTGNALSFNHGVLVDRGIEVVMTALFDPQGIGAVRLEGNGFFRAEPGILIPALTVANQNNRLEGQPLFSGPITLAHSGTTLSIALQNMLNQSIILNGGAITLDDHLHLADEVRLSGSGTIDLNGRQLSFGSSYSAPWSNSLLFKDALDISLNGNIDLTGTWTFSGVCSLHGNGSIINMVDGGQIILDPNTVLYLDDVFVRGLGDTNGKFIFGNRNAQIRSSNSTFGLVSNYLVDIGGIYVEGPTTFALDGNNWTFDLKGSLTVDGVTLWLDPLDTSCLLVGGQIFAPLPLYNSDGTLNSANVAFDIASGTLSLVNHGSIKEVVDRSCVVTSTAGNTCDILLDGSVTTSINLTQCCGCVGPFQRIKIDENVCINGNGTTIEFTNPDTPQLVVSAGKILTLKNISLIRIGANTIDMRPGSRINIDEGVLFEFSEDVTFSQGLLSLTPTCTPNVGDGYIFTMRGIGCRKRINMFPLIPDQILFQVRVNTAQLDNIELGGFSAISQINNPTFLSGAIALASNAVVNIDVDTSMNFFVEGSNNDLVLQDDGITLSGNIAFGDLPDNMLTIKSVLTDPIDPTAPYRAGAASENPLVFFTGNPGVFVFSDTGFAHLLFDDFSFSVNNGNVNAFVVDKSSYMTFNNLEILNNAIKQSSATFRLNGLQLSGLQINPTFIRAPQVFMRHAHIVPTAIYLQRQKEKEYFTLMQVAAQKQHKINTAKQKQKEQKQKDRREKKKNKLKQRPGLENLREIVADSDDLLERALVLDNELNNVGELATTRALNLPPTTNIPRFDQSFANNSIYTPDATVPLKRALRFNRAAVENFTIDPGTDFNILLQNESEMTQSDAQSLAILDNTHIINVSGLGNIINVRRTLQINEGGLLFPTVQDVNSSQNVGLDIQADTELTFQFVDDGVNIPTVILNQDNLVLEQNVTLRFAGRGNVILNNGKTITFNGTQDAKTSAVIARPSLIISDDARFTLAAPIGKNKSVAFMSGIGLIQVSGRGLLEVNNPGSLVIGSTNPPPTNKPNDMQISVFESAEIRVGLDKASVTNLAKISIWNTNLSFVIENNGLLSIIAGGQLEINADVNGASKVLKQGKITTFSISRNGGLFIDALARLVLAKNINDTKFQWRGKQGIFASTCGLVEYVDGPNSPKNFVGHLSATAPDLFTTINLTSEELVELLVQQVPALNFSTVYIDENNDLFLRTIKGISVQLLPGDVILSDNASGVVQGIDASGNAFSYNADGVRS